MLRIVRPELVGFALGTLALGTALLINGVYRRRRWRPTTAWRRAPAEVRDARVLAANDLLGPGDLSDRVPRVEYAYTVDGRTYTGVAAGGSVTLDYPGVRTTAGGLEAAEVRPNAVGASTTARCVTPPRSARRQLRHRSARAYLPGCGRRAYAQPPFRNSAREGAMFPYVEHPVWRFGPVTLYAFGVAVAAAFWFGLSAAQRRFARVGLDPSLAGRAGRWLLVGGVLGAHLFSVLVYFPDKLRRDPWLLLRVWEDISSFGGILGGLLGALLFFRLRTEADERRALGRYLDAVAFVFPGALALGRIGCALAHDHPGLVTAFPLAISLESDAARAYIGGVYEAAGQALPPTVTGMGFHDLGLYELAFLALVLVPLFRLWDRRRRATGFYLAAFAALYLPVRFFLDTLRVADARYLGLTPAQWVAALVFASLPFAVLRHRRLRFAVGGVVVLATAWACSTAGH